MKLLCLPGEAYEQADDSLKKPVNRAIFSRILIQVVVRRVQAEGDEDEVYGQLREAEPRRHIAPSYLVPTWSPARVCRYQGSQNMRFTRRFVEWSQPGSNR